MAHIGKSVQKLADKAGFSLDVLSQGQDEVVQVYKGSVLRGAPVGHAISTSWGGWQAFAGRRASMGKKELGMFQSLDDAIRALLVNSDW
ncbi:MULTISPECIES: hypothetical protein [unclassified Streptomyces]|uniref:hypothetical protein n=1 Tax=unclassified Streptomyces TaxID=2593676 RepID=UPI0036EC011C